VEKAAVHRGGGGKRSHGIHGEEVRSGEVRFGAEQDAVAEQEDEVLRLGGHVPRELEAQPLAARNVRRPVGGPARHERREDLEAAARAERQEEESRGERRAQGASDRAQRSLLERRVQ
jgi:hypothetical protein